ncbi:transposase [Myroides sp. LJL116]
MNQYYSKIIMYKEVHQMKREGFSIRFIAKHLELNWRTTKRLLTLNEQEFEHELENSKNRKRSLEVYTEFVKEKLTTFSDTSAAQMHDWLKEHYSDFPKVNQKTVYNFIMWVRATYNIPKVKIIRQYTMVQEVSYGSQAQVDFGFYNMRTTSGRVVKVQFFCMVLSRSRYKYIEFSDIPYNCTRVIQAHENAFSFFEGIPGQIVYDQDRLFMVDENYGEPNIDQRI